MSSVQSLWLGYGRSSEKATLDLGGPGSKVLLLGSRSDEMAALASLSAKEVGAKPVVLDLGGHVSNTLSGYFDTYDYRSFLYDSFRLEAPESWHSQMAAAAYSLALDLSSEEEAIINSAMQQVASDGSLLSPVSVHDVMGKVEGFRGFYVDKLNGRIGSLKHFDAVEDQTFARLADGNVILDFHRSPYPQAAELAAALFLAKALTLAHATGDRGSLLIITEAHRLFRSSPRPMHSNRLLTHLVGWPAPTAFASDQPQALNPHLLRSCSVRLYSSDAWHSQARPSERMLQGTLLLEDRRRAKRMKFVPRRVQSKTGDYAQARPAKFTNPALTRSVLEHVDSYPLSTPESVVQYLAPEFLPTDTSAALDSLQRRRALIIEPKDTGSGPKVFCLTLTEEGRKLLKELRG